MNSFFKSTYVVPVLITGLGWILAGQVSAQTFTTLHSFSWLNNSTNSGAIPVGKLILSGNTLYGTTERGGTFLHGAVFAINTDGSGFTNVHGFTGGSGGSNPQSGLILSGDTLYGTATLGGTLGKGMVFALNTDGTGFTNLHNFTDNDGVNPFAGLILSGNTLYGTTQYGGIVGDGTVFALNTDGTSFTNLHSFNNRPDGATPIAGLILSGNSLYGTAWYGGGSGNGTVFVLNTDGSGFTNLHSFSLLNGSGTNSDGAGPQAGLVLSGNTLYGTTSQGGSSGNGTVFAINTDGTGFTNLHNFTGSDGAAPDAAPLVLSGHTLYGTADSGGSSGDGTVFAVNTDGTGFTTLYNFTATTGSPNLINSDGATPLAGLILTNNILYGTAASGGSSGKGTVFSLSFRPQLTILTSGADVILTWPTNYAGFDYTDFILQSATNLASPAVWTASSPGQVVVNGQNIVTNPISGSQQYYRLSQ